MTYLQVINEKGNVETKDTNGKMQQMKQTAMTGLFSSSFSQLVDSKMGCMSGYVRFFSQVGLAFLYLP